MRLCELIVVKELFDLMLLSRATHLGTAITSHRIAIALRCECTAARWIREAVCASYLRRKYRVVANDTTSSRG